jgi:hypothetical protein
MFPHKGGRGVGFDLLLKVLVVGAVRVEAEIVLTVQLLKDRFNCLD